MLEFPVDNVGSGIRQTSGLVTQPVEEEVSQPEQAFDFIRLIFNVIYFHFHFDFHFDFKFSLLKYFKLRGSQSFIAFAALFFFFLVSRANLFSLVWELPWDTFQFSVRSNFKIFYILSVLL